MTKKFTIGTDPEFFIVNSFGFLKSAIPFINGTKYKPFLLKNGAGLQQDNVAVEFSSPVAEDLSSFLRSINISLRLVSKQLPFGYKIATDIAGANFPKEELNHPSALEFGCDPDYNAWTLTENEKEEQVNPVFRSCGGHIHVGHVEHGGYDFLKTIKGKVKLVKVMDCLHGFLSTFLDNNKGTKERRQLYGGAGCFRITDYGIEYRTLSNYWVANNTYITLMYCLTKNALDIVDSGKSEALIAACGGEATIQKSINEHISDLVTRSRVKAFLDMESSVAYTKAELVAGVFV